MIDPKEQDDLKDFKVVIPEWYGSFELNTQAETTEQAGLEMVRNMLTDDESLPETGTLEIEVWDNCCHRFEVFEDSDKNLCIRAI